MDSRFLKSLIAVIDSGSIAEAARAEHLTAAAISQRIKSLEQELGFELLCRSGHSAKATEACLKILPRARHIVNEVRLIACDAKLNAFTDTLRLGVIPSQLTSSFVSKVDALRLQLPKTRVSLSQNTSRSLYASLIKDEIDGAILEQPDFELPKTVNAYLLRKELLVLISQKKSNLSVQELLQNDSYIEYLPDPFICNIARKYLEDQNLTLRSTCDTGSLQAIKILVSDGSGVSLVPKWQGLDNCDSECVVTELDDERYARNIVLLTSKLNNQIEIFEKLVKILLK